jgi:hypothetical protein
MKAIATAIAFGLAASSACAVELPARAFYSGNDVYDLCQTHRIAALAYVAGLYDEAAHAAWVIDGTRITIFSNPQRDLSDRMADYALSRVVGYCVPRAATLDQVTDVFCKYLRDTPEERHGLPPILFSEALTKAWPCPDK